MALVADRLVTAEMDIVVLVTGVTTLVRLYRMDGFFMAGLTSRIPVLSQQRI